MNDLVKTEVALPSPFQSLSSFEDSQRVAKALASSSLVPGNYQNNVADCLIAMELSNRVGMSVFAAMQNLYVIHGRPSWSAQFLISMINSCGRFKPLKFTIDGDGDNLGCVAYTEDMDGNEYASTRVTIGMAKNEGWYERKGSKWKTLPDQMLCYRAAAFFSRLYCPELSLGMQTREELVDITPDEIDITGAFDAATSAGRTDKEPEGEAKPAEVIIPAKPEEEKPKEKPATRKRPRRGGASPKKKVEEAPKEESAPQETMPAFDGPVPGDDDGIPF